jgi:peptidyl-prolyl cis-trans isomerase-like 3
MPAPVLQMPAKCAQLHCCSLPVRLRRNTLILSPACPASTGPSIHPHSLPLATAENFLALAASGYYNDCKFHRNIKAFMVQGGDPTGTGKGGKSIYQTPNGKFPDEIADHLKHNKRGIVSMANSGPNTNGSQFFITYKAHPHLNGKYTIFGQVIDGMEVLDRMEKVPTGANDRPLQEMKIQSCTIHANPLAQ